MLLCGDAAYALQPGSAPFTALSARGLALYVLAEDAQARAIEVPGLGYGCRLSGLRRTVDPPRQGQQLANGALTVGARAIELDKDGFLVELSDWSADVASAWPPPKTSS